MHYLLAPSSDFFSMKLGGGHRFFFEKKGGDRFFLQNNRVVVVRKINDPHFRGGGAFRTVEFFQLI